MKSSQILIRTLTLTLGIMNAWCAQGATGWVGNSPMLMAASDSSSLIHFGSAGATQETNTNSLLLKDDESRLTIGFGEGAPTYSQYGESRSSTQGVFGFDYGLSDNWTLLNLTALGYNLKGGGREDHHLALYFGVIDGIGYGSSQGFVASVGAGLLHSVESGDWKITNSLKLSGNYCSKNRDYLPNDYSWRDVFAKLRINVSRRLGDKWAVGVGAESILGEYTKITEVDGLNSQNQRVFDHYNVTRKKEHVLLFANPSLSFSRKLLDKGMLTWNLGLNERESGSANPNLGSYLTFTTEW